MTKYLVIYEQGHDGWSAYSPDVDGCYAAGGTRQEVEQLMREAIPFHLESMRVEGVPPPTPVHAAGYVAA
jgi:predicted RNase H-like HicB family nuclease